jgi:hypothetical protein
MNSNNHPGASPTTNMQPSSTAIEANVQKFQASLRQERDKARRDYELATERLALLKDEVQQAEAGVQERQTKLAEMRQEMERLGQQSSIRETVASLTKEVGPLQVARASLLAFFFLAFSKVPHRAPFFLSLDQADFQHAEILAKEQKTKDLQKSLQSSTLKRKKTLHEMQKLLQHHDEQLANKPILLDYCRPEALADELHDDPDLRERYTTTDWTRLVRRKVEMYKGATESLRHDEIPILERIAGCYKQQFPILQKEQEDPVDPMDQPEEPAAVEETSTPAESAESTETTD